VFLIHAALAMRASSGKVSVLVIVNDWNEIMQ
jgi:hypothetical protein